MLELNRPLYIVYEHVLSPCTCNDAREAIFYGLLEAILKKSSNCKVKYLSKKDIGFVAEKL